MKKKTKKTLMIGAALLGGYLLLSRKKGAEGGYEITSGGALPVGDSKKGGNIYNITVESEDYPSFTPPPSNGQQSGVVTSSKKETKKTDGVWASTKKYAPYVAGGLVLGALPAAAAYGAYKTYPKAKKVVKKYYKKGRDWLF